MNVRKEKKESKLQLIDGEDSKILKISRPFNNKNSKVEMYKGDNVCTCSEKDNSEREMLISAANSLSILKDQFINYDDKSKYTQEELKIQIEESEKDFEELQENVKPSDCQCWASNVYKEHGEDIFDQWDNVKRNPYFERNGIKYYEDTDGGAFWYAKNGKKYKLFSHIHTYYMDPHFRKLEPCTWHGDLCVNEKEKVDDIYKDENLSKDEKLKQISKFAGRSVEGLPPTYGIYALHENKDGLQIICYDTCSHELRKSRKLECDSNQKKKEEVRRFVKDKTTFTAITEKYANFKKINGEYTDTVKELKGANDKLNWIVKNKITDSTISKLETGVQAAKRDLENAIKLREALWEQKSEDMDFGTKNKELEFEEVLEMDEPDSGDIDKDELYKLVSAYYDFNKVETALIEEIVDDDEYDKAADIYEAEIELKEKEIMELYKKVFINESKNNDGKDIETRKQIFMSNMEQETAKKVKIAEENLKLKTIKMADDEREIPKLKLKINNLIITIEQLRKTVETFAESLYLEGTYFLERTQKVIDFSNTKGFVYTDSDKRSTEKIGKKARIEKFKEMQSQFQSDLRNLLEQRNGLINKIKAGKNFLKYDEKTLKEKYSKWLKQQEEYSKSRNQRIKVVKKKKAPVAVDINDFAETLDLFSSEEKVISFKAPAPVEQKKEEEECFKKKNNAPKAINPTSEKKPRKRLNAKERQEKAENVREIYNFKPIDMNTLLEAENAEKEKLAKERAEQKEAEDEKERKKKEKAKKKEKKEKKKEKKEKKERREMGEETEEEKRERLEKEERKLRRAKGEETEEERKLRKQLKKDKKNKDKKSSPKLAKLPDFSSSK